MPKSSPSRPVPGPGSPRPAPRGSGPANSQPATPGRPPSTSRSELERVAFELFDRRGFERVTVEDIASAAGIGRRTFFRYFESKNDVVWGDFAGELARLRSDLAVTDPSDPPGRALAGAIVAFNTYPDEDLAGHRRRMTLILTVPELQAHSTLQYAAWREAVAQFVAGRTGRRATDLEPRVIAHGALGASVAAYEEWLRGGEDREGHSLVQLMARALGVWARGLA